MHTASTEAYAGGTMNLARERPILCSLLAATCWLVGSVAHGQSGRRLEGRILDETGAWIPEATVTLYSDDRVRTTTADGDGTFVFTGLTVPLRYVEASSTGFLSSSISMTDGVAEPISITLHVGSCASCPIVESAVDVRAGSVDYEERSGREQLTGSGPLLRNTSLNLMKAGLEATERTLPTRRSPAMKERSFKYAFVAQVVSNEQGEFRFAGLEPGWYSLEAVHDGYDHEIAKFWIARETLTRLSRIEMLPRDPSQPSPFRSISETPLAPSRDTRDLIYPRSQ
jgi:hypothetical protein